MQYPETNGYVIHTSTYGSLTPVEQESPEEVKLRDDFDTRVNEILGHATTLADLVHMGAETTTHEIYEDADDGRVEPAEEDDSSDPVDKGVTLEELDGYIAAEFLLPLGNTHITRKVRWKKRDREGNLHGTANTNSILNSRTYEVEFPNGEISEYSSNVIAENMFAQCNSEGNQFLLMDAIVEN